MLPLISLSHEARTPFATEKPHEFPLCFNPWNDTEWSRWSFWRLVLFLARRKGIYVVKMGGFRLSSHVSPCSETCYSTSRIEMPKEPSGGSAAFLCISNQGVIFLAIFCVIVAKHSSSLPEELRCGYKALQNPALLLFLSKNTQLLLYTLFTFEASRESQLQSRTGQ